MRQAFTLAAMSAVLVVGSIGGAWAQQPPAKLGVGNESEVILKDSQKSDPETPAELAKCMSQWGPQTQMTKEEWAASCRATLHYYPESR